MWEFTGTGIKSISVIDLDISIQCSESLLIYIYTTSGHKQ